MTVGPSSTGEPAWPDLAVPRPRRRGRLASFAIAVASGLAVFLVVPPASFLARSIVTTVDGPADAAGRGAETGVSNPVIQRAAASLIGAGFAAPAPDGMERISLALGLAGTRPTGGQSRLALAIARDLVVRADATSGSLAIEASSPDSGAAEQIATAVAVAWVAERDERAAKARGGREAERLSRIERLRTDAGAARRRLAALGGLDADPAQARAAAAAQTAASQVRLDAIRAIVAASTPPLGDRRDVPPAIEALQNAYLDLSRQLATARETLGDRHTTIIALQDGVRRAAAGLNAGWKRLARLAEVELDAARTREAALRQAPSPSDAKRRDAILDARRHVEVADEDLARAQSEARDDAGSDAGFSVRPALPATPVGFGTATRALIALLMGVLTLALGSWGQGAVRSIRRRMAAAGTPADKPDIATLANDAPAAVDARKATIGPRGHARPGRGSRPEGPDEERADLPREAAPISARFGDVPTIMVATCEGLATTPRAVAIGRAAARAGRRVLIVEAGRAATSLAAIADIDAAPILLDAFGTLRIALPAETRGKLFIAPALAGGADLAARLARGGETPLIESLGTAFDLIVVDGGDAETCAAAGWGADAYLRVGRIVSARDDERFLEIFDDPLGELLDPAAAASVTTGARADTPAMRRGATRRVARASKVAAQSASSPALPLVTTARRAQAPRR